MKTKKLKLKTKNPSYQKLTKENIGRVFVTLQGLSPLLLGGLTIKVPSDPDARSKRGCDKTLYAEQIKYGSSFSAGALKNCALNAVHLDTKRRKRPQERVRMQGAFVVSECMGPIRINGPKPKSEVRKLSFLSNTSIKRRYLRFDKWEVPFLVVYNKSLTSKKEICEFYKTAGAWVGLGDHRPEKGGRNGTFEVKNTTVL